MRPQTVKIVKKTTKNFGPGEAVKSGIVSPLTGVTTRMRGKSSPTKRRFSLMRGKFHMMSPYTGTRPSPKKEDKNKVLNLHQNWMDLNPDYQFYRKKRAVRRGQSILK